MQFSMTHLKITSIFMHAFIIKTYFVETENEITTGQTCKQGNYNGMNLTIHKLTKSHIDYSRFI